MRSFQLFKHQEEALKESLDKSGYLYAHEMGLGKSCTALTDAVRHKVKFLFVIAPVGVAQAWIVDHAPKYAAGYFKSAAYIQGGKIYDANNDKVEVDLHTPLLLAINFEAIRGKHFDLFYQLCMDLGDEGMFVVDESHRIKNPKSITCKAILKIAELFKYKRALTGTPIGNGHQDLFSQLKFVMGKEFPYKSFYAYSLDFCSFGGFKNKQIVGDRHSDSLKKLMAPYAHVAQKDECLDLPPKIYKRLYLELSPSVLRLYKQAKARVLQLESGKDLTISMNAMNTMRNITSGFVEDDYLYESWESNPKIQALNTILEDHAAEKCVIFVSYIREGNMLSEALDIPFYSGATSQTARNTMLDDFKANKTQHIIATIQTLGTGHDLNMANIVVFYSNDYSYLLRSQAEDRCHRIGQSKPVIVYDLVIQNTIDEKILKVLEHKGNVADLVLKKGLNEFI